MIYRFGDYVLDTARYELLKSGAPQHLEPQVFDVLAQLIENRDRLVTKDELLERVWGDKFVSEAALNSRLAAARRVIGDNGRDQRLIRTQHARGFRFVGDVLVEDSEPPARQPSAEDAARQSRQAGGEESQTIRFCEAPDGVHIAYATVGSGPPIVKAPNWLTHLEYEWQNPVWRHWWQELTRDFTVIRFDQRGSGLSDRDVDDLSFERWVGDLEAVVDAAGVDRFALLGISQGGAAAIEYTARHPERVTHLVLYGAIMRGWTKRGHDLQEQQALLTLMREGWGRDTPLYRQLFTHTFMPDATPEQVEWFNELQRVSTSAENAARLRTESGQIDVVDRLADISVPTLVLHARGDLRVAFDEGRRLASLIPGARFVPLDSRNHLTLEDEPAWPKLIAEVRSFLAPLAAEQQASVGRQA
jgi:pimeloyl-ACP methyl ester carboxylesterase/DNA-binding winged helix-turn-helix (wHTH) protein